MKFKAHWDDEQKYIDTHSFVQMSNLDYQFICITCKATLIKLVMSRCYYINWPCKQMTCDQVIINNILL